MGTDTRGLYYNKVVFAKAGLPVPWHPATLGPGARGGREDQGQEPGVTPINVYGGTGQGEGSTMQGFEMFLYGTNNWLWDSAHSKWEKAGAGFQAAPGNTQRSITRTTWAVRANGPRDHHLADRAARAHAHEQARDRPRWQLGCRRLHTRRGQTVAGLYQGPGRSPYAHREGQGPGHVSMSGGWLLSVGSHAKNKQMAFNFIAMALNQPNSLYYDIHASQVASRGSTSHRPRLTRRRAR